MIVKLPPRICPSGKSAFGRAGYLTPPLLHKIDQLKRVYLSSLIPDIISNYICINPFSNCSCIATITPKFTMIQFLFYFWMPHEQFSSGNAFHKLKNLSRRISRRQRFNQKMHVIFIKPNSFKQNIKPVFNFLAYLFYRFYIFLIEKQIFPILDTKNKMMLDLKNF